MSASKAVEEARLLVGAIQTRDAETSRLYLWRLADLSAQNTAARPGPRVNDAGVVIYGVEEWAKKIGWEEQGNTIGYLKKLITEARAWSEELRVEGRSLDQHRDARAMYKGDVAKASAWLRKLKGPARRPSRSGVDGSGPVYKAMLKLQEARRLVGHVPAVLAGSGILGNEPNFDQFRRELDRLKRQIDYLDRYLADEIVVDPLALDEALNRILEETS